MATPPERLRVGRLTKPHGLKGAVKLELYTDDPARRFTPGATFSLQVPETSPWFGKTLTLRELRWFNGLPVAFFEEFADRTAAETAIRAILWIDMAESEPAEPNAWYDHELVGLHVYRGTEHLGEVAHVDHMPAQDLLSVRYHGREVLVPFVAAIVPEVDIAAGRLYVTPPAGLFEEIPEPPVPEPSDPETPDPEPPVPEPPVPEHLPPQPIPSNSQPCGSTLSLSFRRTSMCSLCRFSGEPVTLASSTSASTTSGTPPPTVTGPPTTRPTAGERAW